MVRNVWDAMVRPPWRFLTSSWPWRSILYLVLGVALGWAAWFLVIALLLTGLVLLIAVVGLLAFLALALFGVPFARLERARLRLVDRDPVPNPHVRPVRRGVRGWLSTRFREQATWREFGYAALSLLALCWVDAGMLFVAIGVPFLLVTTPFYGGDPEAAIYISVAGVVLTPPAVYLLAAWAAARATMARTMLGPQQAELGARLTAVSASRARLVGDFEAERRRIERDLHDGAQRHLVALSMSLGLARLDLPTGSPSAGAVDAAQQHAERALVELRALIRGVHPQVLTDRGLAAAVADIAGDVPVPVDIDVDLPARPPSIVETTTYFCLSEALTNVARHSGASRARVSIRAGAGGLRAEVHDDGRGGADVTAGRGLAGLADRLATIDGRLLVSSPLGGPTVIRIEVPVR